ncbi:MAG TPA: orotidine-5'-phosphate decarboxylase [Actinomycetota bacterium]|nr:orotidine-5'-phosphate decarboxylase [Actinomycetota bacterium]
MTGHTATSGGRLAEPAATANPVCVALDFDDPERIRTVAAATSEHVGVFKIGLTAFASAGPGIVEELSARLPVFLDLKFHDIPAQVQGAVRAAARTGARYTTVHASGGTAMIGAAVEAAGESLTVLAVTVLTSLDDEALDDIGLRGPSRDAVLRLAGVALGAGAPGLVCSPREVAALREAFGTRAGGGPLLVVPGIRGSGEAAGDQKRTTSATEALAAGADLIVVGRPITAAPDPGAAAAALHAEIRS